MKRNYPDRWIVQLSATLLLSLTLFIVNSCRKDIRLGLLSTKADSVTAARQWYESNFPLDAAAKGNIHTAGLTHDKAALYRLITPDWGHAGSYNRFNKDVIEMPLDESVKLGYALNKSNFSFDHNSSKSSFLILNDGQSYSAYIMTIIADSAYLQNDYSKLDQNSYNKRDANFSGYVLYSSPAGDLVTGWHYLNGKINKTVSPNTSAPQSGTLQIQSVHSSKKTLLGCTDNFVTVYTGSSCIVVGSSSTCTDYYDVYDVLSCDDIQSFDPNDPGGGGAPSFPDPSGQGPPAPVNLTIKEDSLKKHFPCASVLIVENLQKIPAYFSWITPFMTNLKPDLTWTDGSLAWNSYSPLTGANSYQIAQTATDPTSGSGKSSIITLNNNALQNSSQLLIAAAAIHETLHAVIALNIATAVDDNLNKQVTNASWMYGLDIWYTVYGLPANYRDHYTMLSSYFSQALNILASWDNNGHTTKEYAEALLFGLNTSGITPGTPQNDAEINILNTEYSNILAQYGISSSDLTTFNQNNLNSSTNKLPTSGCN